MPRCPDCGSNDHFGCLPAVSPLDMWYLLLDTVRYSFGRMTAAPDDAVRMVLKYADYLKLHQLKQIAREINDELLRHKRWEERPLEEGEKEEDRKQGGPMGQACDVRTWVEGRDAILALVLKREQTGERDY